MPSTSSSSFNGRVPHPNVVSSQSVAGKYDKRSEPPAKPPRTFLELQFPSNRNLKLRNEELSHLIVKKFRNRQFWMDIGQRTMLFANPFDDLSGQRIARKSCCSHESTLIEEAMKHGNYSILVRGQSGSGKSALAERLFLRVLVSFSTQAYLETGRAVIMAIQPLLRYSTCRNPISSMTELGFQFSFDGVKVSRCTISRGAISPIEELPLILSMMMSQLSTKEKVQFQIAGIHHSFADSKSIEYGWTLEQFRSALRKLSISSGDVEKVLCSIILLTSLQIDFEGGFINTHHIENAKNLVNASHLLGVSPNMLKRLIESSSSKDKNRSGVLVTTTLLLETLIDYIIEQANSLLDGGFSRGKESPTASDSSTTDSGIEISRGGTATIEVEMQATDSLQEQGLRKARLLMQSLFSQSNCQSLFAVRLFSLSSPPMRTSSQNADTTQHQSIMCLRTNDDCEYMRPDVTLIKEQLQAVRQRIEETAPEVPIRDY
ncbi:hum-10 [Pristionchus pacificus]|uniref:Hum-10 n=1 Tax=Pristionchus pacificus TaxID=54126 RepID=A0A2A6D0Y6_PRIPA|nr:hum-10 [Pristionchus pacificus]|eukprot:PDM84016.1 hum-10 [Pristionchus pacificus]